MKKKEQQEINKIDCYKVIFNGEKGKIVLRDLLRNCGFFTGTFNADHAHMAFEEGRRSVIMDILRILQIDVNELIEEFNRMNMEDKEYGEY